MKWAITFIILSATTFPALSADLSKEEFLKQSSLLAKNFDNDWAAQLILAAQAAPEEALNNAYSKTLGFEGEPVWLLHYNNGLEAAHKGQWEQAEDDLRVASVDEKSRAGLLGDPTPQYADVFFVRALIKQVRGHLQDSLSDLEKLYKLRTSNPSSWNIGSALFRQKKEEVGASAPTSK
jgi:hypothetical protein